MSENIFQKLKEYGESTVYPFHMPGHKRNSEGDLFSPIYQYDITEIDGFDNLHQPEGILLKAQERAAELYHSQETYFLINGSTSGILSAVSAIANRGKKILIARNCHKSVYHAAFLNRLETEYIYPGIISGYGIADGISAAQIEERIKEIALKEKISLEEISHLIAGVVITSPSYDGILSDVKGIVQVTHNYGIPVIIDQAHGAHFGFHPEYPDSAVSEGADLVIHSVHKTLPAPTQTALLHKNGMLVDSDILKKYLKIYQSSSPSYPLMAGIDSCMEFMQKEGAARLTNLLSMRTRFVKETEHLQYIRIYPTMAEQGLGKADLWESSVAEPGRLLIFVKEGCLTGQELYDILLKKYQLQMEMCGANYVVAILSVMDREEGFWRLADALCELDQSLQVEEKRMGDRCSSIEDIMDIPINYPKQELPISNAFMAKNMEVPLLQAIGQIAADFVNLYPPGIPLLVPGEKIDAEMIHCIEIYLKNGYTLQGINKSEFGKNVLRVIV